MPRFAPPLIALSCMLPCAGCASCAAYRRCDPIEPAQLERLPPKLSQTSFFADPDRAAPSAALRAYEPAFALWSDGASKRRWVELPVSTSIDTTDPDDWIFPVGTRFYKEFARDGHRIETRLLFKWGPGDDDWSGAAYVWLADQSDAVLTPEGARNVDASGYDVPSAAECAACHGGRRSHVLGFSALQLGAADTLPLSLSDLIQEGRLSAPPDVLPVLSSDDAERRALGYLHANCGHCHNAQRPARDGARCYDPERAFDLSLPLAAFAQPETAPAYRSALSELITPGQPDQSRLVQLISRRGWRLHMPPLATDRPDAVGVALIRAWIANQPGGPR